MKNVFIVFFAIGAILVVANLWVISHTLADYQDEKVLKDILPIAKVKLAISVISIVFALVIVLICK